MSKIKVESFVRRRFLRGMTLAAGAARFSPQFFGSTAAAIAIPAKVEAAATDAGQTTRLAEYAVGLRYEEIPAEVLQRAKDCIADTVGTIVFGSQFPWSKMIIAQARRTGTVGNCAVLGTGARGCAPPAAPPNSHGGEFRHSGHGCKSLCPRRCAGAWRYDPCIRAGQFDVSRFRRETCRVLGLLRLVRTTGTRHERT